MSSEALYERYKDALKRGHVASLRGRLEEALSAYAEAATIAPERSTPHTSAATALMRRKRPADALRHYTAALALAPRDEAALLGRAQALAALDRRPEAADAFDALAELRATTGKLADAVDAARRGLELAEGRERRRILERLIERLRASEPGEPGRLALERALRVLEGPAVAQMHAVAQQPAVAATSPDLGTLEHEAAALAADVVAEADEGSAPDAEPATAAAGAGEEAAGEEATDAAQPEPVGAEAEPTGVPEAEPTGVPEAEPEVTDEAVAELAEPGPEVAAVAAVAEPGSAAPEAAAPVRSIRAALDRDLPAHVDIAALTAEAEAAVARGEIEPALDRLLDLAALHRRDGRVDAALDACYLALSVEPDDIGLHLALVELYDQRGWNALANEKLDLLGRLAELDADRDAGDRLAAARAARS